MRKRLSIIGAGAIWLSPLTGCAAETTTVIEPRGCVPAALPETVPIRYEQQARAIADGWMARHEASDMSWDWTYGVLGYGFLELYFATGDEKYRHYVEDWLRSWEGRYPLVWSDNLPPIGSASWLARYSCEPLFRAYSDAGNEYLQEAPRTEAGGISHLGTFAPDIKELWIDSLFMFGMYLQMRAQERQQSSAIDLLAEQFDIFAAALQDSETGLFRHALIDGDPVPVEATFWGRGNGWIVSSLNRFLDTVPAGHPRRGRLEAIDLALMEGVVSRQDEGGMWWTVINRPGEIYLETSATALFADGIRRAGRLGILDAEKATQSYDRAVEAILAQIGTDEQGRAIVNGVSGPTTPGEFKTYSNVKIAIDNEYGVGSVLLALTAR